MVAFIFFLAISILESCPLWAGDFIVTLTAEGKSEIAGFEWLREEPFVAYLFEGPGPKSYRVNLKGKFARQGYLLLIDRETVDLPESGIFEQEIELKGEAKTISVTVIGPFGEVEEARYLIEVLSFQPEPKAITPSEMKKPSKIFRATASIGPTLLWFNQDSTDSRFDSTRFSKILLTFKASVTGIVTPKWSVMTSGYGTVGTLSNRDTAPSTTHSTNGDVRFFGLNLRAAYQLDLSEKTKLALAVGGYYTTMVSADRTFGFQGLKGPQVFPILSHQLRKNGMISSYFKLSLVGENFTIKNLSNRELACGVNYTTLLKNSNAVILAMDLAKLTYQPQTAEIQSTSLSFSIGYGL